MTTKWTLRDRFWIVFYLVLIGVSFIVPEILSKHHYLRQIDLCRFYFAKSAAFIDFMMTWGWILWGIPIPLVFPTTYFNAVFCVKLYGSMGALILSFYKKRGPILVSVVLVLVAIGSLEYERRTLSDFETREELVTFLDHDGTDSMEYTGEFDCEDFSRTLILGARDVGYRLYFHAVENHALCEAYIITENLWVTVEPQTDWVVWGG